MSQHPLKRARQQWKAGEISEPAYRLFLKSWDWCIAHPESNGAFSRELVEAWTGEVLDEMGFGMGIPS